MGNWISTLERPTVEITEAISQLGFVLEILKPEPHVEALKLLHGFKLRLAELLFRRRFPRNFVQDLVALRDILTILAKEVEQLEQLNEQSNAATWPRLPCTACPSRKSFSPCFCHCAVKNGRWDSIKDNGDALVSVFKVLCFAQGVDLCCGRAPDLLHYLVFAVWTLWWLMRYFQPFFVAILK